MLSLIHSPSSPHTLLNKQTNKQTNKNTMLITKRVTRRKIWKINTFSAEKYFFMENIMTRTFLEKANFTSLFKQTVHPFNKSR